jgi:hypothetical protein
MLKMRRPAALMTPTGQDRNRPEQERDHSQRERRSQHLLLAGAMVRP